MRRAALLRIPAALLAAGLLVLADVETKHWASSELRRRGPRTVIENHLALRYQLNSGIAFGLFQKSLHPHKRRLLVGYSLAVALGLSTVLGVRLLRRRAPGWLIPGGLVALLAGTVGNLIDRMRQGAVVDFIDLTLLGAVRWPAFNLADVYLAVGVILCAAGMVIAARREPEVA